MALKGCENKLNPEKVAYWFFRLNGCLTIEDFIVHPDLIRKDEPHSQRTDVDILAVRFPYRSELLTSGKPMEDHEVFNSNGLIDIIIAEVKSGCCRLNGPWTKKPAQNMNRVLYAIGAFEKDKVSTVAENLYSEGSYSDEKYRVRLFAIGNETNDELEGKAVQLTWEEILKFIYKRFTIYRKNKAQHEQWDCVGKKLYELCNKYEEEDFISIIYREMKTT